MAALSTGVGTGVGGTGGAGASGVGVEVGVRPGVDVVTGVVVGVDTASAEGLRGGAVGDAVVGAAVGETVWEGSGDTGLVTVGEIVGGGVRIPAVICWMGRRGFGFEGTIVGIRGNAGDAVGVGTGIAAEIGVCGAGSWAGWEGGVTTTRDVLPQAVSTTAMATITKRIWIGTDIPVKRPW